MVFYIFQKEEEDPAHQFHDHCSDRNESDDSDASGFEIQRSSSFSDAVGMLAGQHYYESFRIETPSPPMGHMTATGLHHRSRNTNNSNANAQSPIRQLQFDVEEDRRSRIQSRSNKRFPTTAKRCNWIRNFFAVIVVVYSLIIFRTMFWMYNIPFFSSSTNIPEYPGQQEQQQQQYQQQLWVQRQRIVLKRDATMEFQKRAHERLVRSRPPPSPTNMDQNDTRWYTMERQQTRSSREETLLDEKPADQVCGAFAQRASLNHPEAYTARAALNSKSVVLITGILNPVGLSLALYLKERCGVQKLVGIDNMYPNTVLNRIQLQDRLQLLTTTFPKMKAVILPFIGLDPKYKKGSAFNNQNEEYNIMDMKPTHVVHLSSYAQEVYSDAQIDPHWINTNSPYIDDEDDARHSYLYQLRSSMISMEQILSSILSTTAERPQFVFASSLQTATATATSDGILHSTTKSIDEVLADTYHDVLEGIPSISLRFPNAIYGPWGKPGGLVYDMIENMVQDWNENMEFTKPTSTSPNLNLLYMDDAVEAIVGALQYQATKPISMDVPGMVTSSSSLGRMLESFLPNGSKYTSKIGGLEKLVVSDHENELLADWSPQITVRDGMLRTIAWHLDRSSPNGPAVRETGDAFLKRNELETCSPEDLVCHKGHHYLPCLSECNIRDQCLPSIFDNVHKLVQSTTDGCNIVLYTQSLGYNVEDLHLQAEYMDEDKLNDGDLLLCNLAFVPRDSDVVKKVIGKVPDGQLVKFGIETQDSDGSLQERKLDGLNGRLLYRGWILIWVQDNLEPLSVTDRSLLKLSPGRFFHSDVKSALFVEENFSVSPNVEDCKFLVHELRRKALDKRTAKVMRDGVKHRYQLPKEPQRRAAVLFAPLRYPNVDDPTVQKYRHGQKKLTVLDASKFMRYEVGIGYDEKEPQSIRRQREFYERVPNFVNRDKELRSAYEPYYLYSMRHWVRTRWVVHDIKLEESRLLRCDWYREHVQWGTEIDQLSFAHVMALRDVKRRIAHHEPEDKVKTFIEKYPELRPFTDSYEWYAMETESNKLYQEPIQWIPQVPEHLVALQADKPEKDEEDENEAQDKNVPIFVRIMSEKIMGASRKRWMKNHKKKEKETQS